MSEEGHYMFNGSCYVQAFGPGAPSLSVSG